MREQKLSFKDLNITFEEIFEAMGYGGNMPDQDIKVQTEALVSEASVVTFPSFMYVFKDGLLDKDYLTVDNQTFHVGRIIGRQLRKSEQYAFFVATAGIEFDNWKHELKERGDIVADFIADSLGSVIAEKTGDCMEQILAHELKQKVWKHTNRFSPGYCEWHISEQKKLFWLFPSEKPCGVTLTDSSLMMPIKSISGIIGLGTDVKRVDYTCNLCTFENCYKKLRKPA